MFNNLYDSLRNPLSLSHSLSLSLRDQRPCEVSGEFIRNTQAPLKAREQLLFSRRMKLRERGSAGESVCSEEEDWNQLVENRAVKASITDAPFIQPGRQTRQHEYTLKTHMHTHTMTSTWTISVRLKLCFYTDRTMQWFRVFYTHQESIASS